MFFLVDKYSSLSYIKLINKLRKRLSSLRYLIMSVFILASFPSPLNFLKKVAATLCFSFLLPTFLTPLYNCHQKFTVQLKAPAKFKGIFHPRFLQCWLFLPTFCLFEEKIFLEGKTKTSSLGSCHLEPFWFSDIFFFPLHILYRHFSIPTHHICSSVFYTEASFLRIYFGQLSAPHTFPIILSGLMALSALILPSIFSGIPDPIFMNTANAECSNSIFPQTTLVCHPWFLFLTPPSLPQPNSGFPLLVCAFSFVSPIK